MNFRIEPTLVLRPYAGTRIEAAAKSAVELYAGILYDDDNVLFSFNGWYAPIYESTTVDDLIDGYNRWCKR